MTNLDHSFRLSGLIAPPLSGVAEVFLSGQQVDQPNILQSLGRQISQGDAPLPDAERPADPALANLWLCLHALQDPNSLQQWDESLLEGDHFPGFLARLLGWSRLQEWMDNAPVTQEETFRAQLGRCRFHAAWLGQRLADYPLLSPWFWREKARLVGFEGGDPMPWIEKSLHLAGRLRQWSEVAKNRAFLAQQPNQSGPALDRTQRQQLDRLLEVVPIMAAATSPAQLHALLLQTLLQLLPLEAALWLEKKADWQVLDWSPRQVHPRYSQSLVEQCLNSRELSWGQPEQLLASRSILLSEVRSVLAVPLGERSVLFVWQSAEQSWLSKEQVEVIQFLARLAGMLETDLALTELARQDLQQAEVMHRRWLSIFRQAQGLALAEVDTDGSLQTWNADFAQLFPEAREGVHVSELLPEAEKARDQQRLHDLIDSSSSLVRLDQFQPPRWYQITDWKVAGLAGIFRAIIDVSAREVGLWFDYLEELYHRLASDLHDGPAQIAAVLKMTTPEPAVNELFNGLRDRLDILRSPWIENTTPQRWSQELCLRLLPECTLELSSVEVSRRLEQNVYRILGGLMEELSHSSPPQQLTCQITSSQATLVWQPPRKIAWSGCFEEMVTARMVVLGGSWTCSEGQLELIFQA